MRPATAGRRPTRCPAHGLALSACRRSVMALVVSALMQGSPGASAADVGAAGRPGSAGDPLDLPRIAAAIRESRRGVKSFEVVYSEFVDSMTSANSPSHTDRAEYLVCFRFKGDALRAPRPFPHHRLPEARLRGEAPAARSKRCGLT